MSKPVLVFSILALLLSGFSAGAASPIRAQEFLSGTNQAGDDVSTAGPAVSVSQAPLKDAAQISAGFRHTCVLTGAGDVRCWGWNGDGQLGDGTVENRHTPVNVVGLESGVQAIAAGKEHTCVLLQTGGVKCWGANDKGQLGDGTKVDSSVPVDVVGLDSGMTALGAGGTHTCAVTAAGGVKCWGDGNSGKLGDGGEYSQVEPVDVAGLPAKVTAVALSYRHTCALTAAGGVVCWGDNGFGELGNGTFDNSLTPVYARGLTSGVKAIVAGQIHTCALTEAGGAKCWGYGTNGQLGVQEYPIGKLNEPWDVIGLTSGVKQLTARYDHTCALLQSGSMKCWGLNMGGQLGNGEVRDMDDPERLPVDVTVLNSAPLSVAAGETHTCAITSSEEVICWGNNRDGQVGSGAGQTRYQPVDVVGLAGASAVAAGRYHACAIVSGGAVECWGYNDTFELGDKTQVQRGLAAPVIGISYPAVAITAGWNHTCVLNDQHGVQCWGAGGYGQLGRGQNNYYYWPSDVVGLTSGVESIASGYNHTCAVTASGGVKCWGSNYAGALGNQSIYDSAAPVDVTGLPSGVKAVGAGWHHTCVLTDAGGVKCWGDNSHGELGDGTQITRSSPVDVTGLNSGVKALALGGAHTCALTDAGGVKCWGNINYSLTPIDVAGLTSGVAAIDSGHVHACAVTEAGGLKCWGQDTYASLGDGSLPSDDYLPPSLAPVDVVGLGRGVKAVDAGYNSTCALLDTGEIRCWGQDIEGQLGVGSDVINLSAQTVVDGSSRVTLNHSSGGVCSYLTVTAEGFPGSAGLMVSVNGQMLTDTLVTTESGGQVFVLDTCQANVGSYTVTVGESVDASAANGFLPAASALKRFTLMPGGSARPQAGSGDVFVVPGGIGGDIDFIYLTLLRK